VTSATTAIGQMGKHQKGGLFRHSGETGGGYPTAVNAELSTGVGENCEGSKKKATEPILFMGGKIPFEEILGGSAFWCIRKTVHCQ